MSAADFLLMAVQLIGEAAECCDPEDRAQQPFLDAIMLAKEVTANALAKARS